jgi:hypothetical protein
MGNLFARRAGKIQDVPPVFSGSHLDTQPSGGRFDGILGVLGALEVESTLNDHGVETDSPIEIVVWTNEEGARFHPAMMGSGVLRESLNRLIFIPTRIQRESQLRTNYGVLSNWENLHVKYFRSRHTTNCISNKDLCWKQRIQVSELSQADKALTEHISPCRGKARMPELLR